jgi:hypothetical protein
MELMGQKPRPLQLGPARQPISIANPAVSKRLGGQRSH